MKKKSKKIVYFHRYPVEFEAEQFPACLPLLQSLKKNYRVIYWSMKPPKAEQNLREGLEFREMPFEVNRFDTRDKWLKTLKFYFSLKKTIAEIKKLNPDLIICKETLPFVPSLLARTKIPLLIDISDWWWSIMLGKNRFGRKFAGFMEGLEVRDWNRFRVVAVTHTKSESKLMLKKGFSKNKIEIINAQQHKFAYFPISNNSSRARLGLKKDDWIVAVHGIMHPSKGYDQLLEWWKKIIKKHENWKLLFIGGSGEEKKYRRMVKDLDLSKNVIMTGWLPNHQQVNLYLNSADCLLVTRRNTPENVGIIPSSLYHNLAVGKPTLATGLPGMSEIIVPNVNGYIFKPDSYSSFQFALEFIHDNPKKAAAAGKAGILTAKKSFDMELCASKYAGLIRRIAGL